MKYLVLVSDVVARHVIVNADSAEAALQAASRGDWSLSDDVQHEEVVERQAEEVIDEAC